MMKKTYEGAEITIVRLAEADILTTSGMDGDMTNIEGSTEG